MSLFCCAFSKLTGGLWIMKAVHFSRKIDASERVICRTGLLSRLVKALLLLDIHLILDSHSGRGWLIVVILIKLGQLYKISFSNSISRNKLSSLESSDGLMSGTERFLRHVITSENTASVPRASQHLRCARISNGRGSFSYIDIQHWTATDTFKNGHILWLPLS